jgi:hypothetical protein
LGNLFKEQSVDDQETLQRLDADLNKEKERREESGEERRGRAGEGIEEGDTLAK